MDKKKLVETLKLQHRELQASLASVKKVVESDIGDRTTLILKGLSKFKDELLAHLKLENEVFYKDYFEKKSKLGSDVARDEDFMKEMVEIEAKVTSFLEKYDTESELSSGLVALKVDLGAVIGVLNSRIETEEEGVYAIYLLLG